jgi:uncharacterized protein (DUF2141 family)
MRRTMLIVATALAIAGLALLAPGGATAAGLGQFCGGILGIQCDQGLFCPLIYRPVCGCNGKTFVNNCTRQVARVSLKHNGRC